MPRRLRIRLAARCTRFGAAAALLFVTAPSLTAQTADSLPFRAGQWAAEFSAANFGGVGVLRFSDARRAWLADVQGRFTRQSGGNSDGGPEFPIVTDAEALQLRLGRRHYGVLAPRVVRQLTWGVVGSYGRSEQRPSAFFVSAPIQYESVRGDYAAGLFAELGAQWLITSNLGFGAAWTATLQAGRSEVERLTIPASGQIMRTTTGVNTISGSLGALAVRGTVYF